MKYRLKIVTRGEHRKRGHIAMLERLIEREVFERMVEERDLRTRQRRCCW
jgi:hypothetical protein